MIGVVQSMIQKHLTSCQKSELKAHSLFKNEPFLVRFFQFITKSGATFLDGSSSVNVS